jgi:hypothetical protein
MVPHLRVGARDGFLRAPDRSTRLVGHTDAVGVVA